MLFDEFTNSTMQMHCANHNRTKHEWGHGHGYILPPYVDKPKRPNRAHHKYTYNFIRAQSGAYLYSYLPKTIVHLPVPKINSPGGADTASGEYTELRSVA